jgi:hypothetical protein
VGQNLPLVPQSPHGRMWSTEAVELPVCWKAGEEGNELGSSLDLSQLSGQWPDNCARTADTIALGTESTETSRNNNVVYVYEM